MTPSPSLTLDTNGYLSSITNPAGEVNRFSYPPDGLLTGMTDAKGNRSESQGHKSQGHPLADPRQ